VVLLESELDIVAELASSVHPGTSLHPSSPLPMISSLKPPPIHNGPLRPFSGRSGPKAAGRARKNVELSSVRLMIADGGNSEPGDVKEKSGFILLFLGETVCALVTSSRMAPKPR
jgi:hypothetical protein